MNHALILLTLAHLAASQESAPELWSVWASNLQTRETVAGSAQITHRNDGLNIRLELPGREAVDLRLNSDRGQLRSEASDSNSPRTWPGSLSGELERNGLYRAFTGGQYRDASICRRSLVLESEQVALWLSRQDARCSRWCWEGFDPRVEGWQCPQ